MSTPVFELRVAVTTSDYERLVKFYCDGLGLKPAAIWNNDGGQALIIDMGRATLEIFDEAQAQAMFIMPGYCLIYQAEERHFTPFASRTLTL